MAGAIDEQRERYDEAARAARDGTASADPAALVEVRGLAVAAGNLIVQSGLTFDIRHGEVLVVMGPSGYARAPFPSRGAREGAESGSGRPWLP